MNKYLLYYMIVHNYQVVQRVLNTDGLQMHGAFKVPAYDEENFPFCITYDDHKNINVVNTKEGTMKSLVNWANAPALAIKLIPEVVDTCRICRTWARPAPA